MPLPKLSKYVRDGEVDPGIASVARAIQDTFALTNYNWSAAGIDPRDVLAKDRELTERSLFCFSVAAMGLGSFSEQVFREAADVAGRGPYVLAHDHGMLDTDGHTLVTSPWEEQWYRPLHENHDFAEKLYRRYFENQPDRELVVEALMFFDPTGKFGDEDMRVAADAAALAREVAEKTASAVPVLGRKWIVAGLVSRGVPVSTAKRVAMEIYTKGGNYLGWKQAEERRQEVADILVRFDPQVSDEQIDAVAASPLPLSSIATTFGALAEARASGGTRTSSSGSAGESAGPDTTTMLVVAALAAAGGYYFWKRRK